MVRVLHVWRPWCSGEVKGCDGGDPVELRAYPWLGW